MSAGNVIPFPVCQSEEGYRCPMAAQITAHAKAVVELEAFRCVTGAQLATQSKAVIDLEAWQNKQNGALLRIEAKMDALIIRLQDRVSGVHVLLIGFLSGALIAAMGWVVLLLRGRA